MESSTSSFSSLTLFECTISNATMLVDSMSNKELLSAWRISGQLQNKIVEVLDPRMAELTLVAELHSKCPLLAPCPQPLSLDRSLSDIDGVFDGASAPKIPRFANTCSDAAANIVNNTSLRSWKSEESYYDEAVFTTVKKEECNGDSEDECVILEEMTESVGNASLNNSYSGSGFLPSAHLDSSSFSCLPSSNSGAQYVRAHGRSAHASTSDSISGDSRNVMRLAYKQLKGDGPHLFDFSKPFSAAVNQAVAARVAQQARQLPQCQNWDEATWHKCRMSTIFSKLRYDVSELARQTVAHKSRKYQKLSRRQRAFESLMQSSDMNSELMDRYRTILSREFTSSDEEIDEGSATCELSGTASSNEDSQLLRVRRLVWESAEVSSLKAVLDDIYIQRFASEKQRVGLSRTVRSEQAISRRTKPSSAPSWSTK